MNRILATNINYDFAFKNCVLSIFIKFTYNIKGILFSNFYIKLFSLRN